MNIPRTQLLNLPNSTSLIFAPLIIKHLVLHWMYFRNIRKCFITKQKTALNEPTK